MIFVSEHLTKIADIIKGEDVEVDADCHFISITCNNALADKLVAAELAEEDPFEDEEEEDNE